MTVRVACLAPIALMAIACGRSMPATGAGAGARQADAGPTVAIAPYGDMARQLCPEAVRRFEECVEKPVPDDLARRSAQEPVTIEPLDPHDVGHGWINLEVHTDAGVVIAYAEQVETWPTHRVILNQANSLMDEYIRWCTGAYGNFVGIPNPNDPDLEPDGGKQAVWERDTDATEDAGESRRVIVSLSAIRERVLVQAPACLKERERAIEAGAP
jgi:hypothetical protein